MVQTHNDTNKSTLAGHLQTVIDTAYEYGVYNFAFRCKIAVRVYYSNGHRENNIIFICKNAFINFIASNLIPRRQNFHHDFYQNRRKNNSVSFFFKDKIDVGF